MQWQTVGIPLIGGLDTLTDPKAVKPPKLTACSNAVFTTPGAIRKRYGSTALNATYFDPTASSNGAWGPFAMPTARRLMAFGDELLSASDENLYSYSASVGKWRQVGGMSSVMTTLRNAPKVSAAQNFADRAQVNGYVLHAWEDSRGGVYASFEDSTTGTVIWSQQLISATAQAPRCLAVGNYLHLYYEDAGTTLKVIAINTATTPAPQVTLVPVTISNVHANGYGYDVTANPDSVIAIIAFTTTTPNITLGSVSNSGTFTSKATWTAAGTLLGTVGVAFEPINDNVGVVWTETSGGVDRKARMRVYNSTMLTNLVASTDIDTEAGITAPINITACWRAATVGGKYRCVVFTGPIGSSTPVRKIYADTDLATITSAAASNFVRTASLASRPWRDGAYTYVHVMPGTVSFASIQAAYVVMRDDGLVVGRVLAGKASLNYVAGLPQVETVSSRKYAWAPTYANQLASAVTVTTASAVFAERTVKVVSYDFNSSQSHRSTQAGKALYISGAMLWAYDGTSAVESGFLFFPENITSSQAAGAIPTGSYSYKFYWEWTNAKGEREQSTVGAAVSVAMGANKKITFTVPTLTVTNKSSGAPTVRTDVGLAVFRTQITPNDSSPFYRCSSTIPGTSGDNGYVYNSTTADTITFVDNMTDATLGTKEEDYQFGGELDNVAPPAHTVLASAEDRVFLAGLDNPNEVQFSKQHSWGQPLAFNDELTIEVPEDGGAITALAPLNANLIVFKANKIYGVPGTAPNNLGQNGYQEPQLISSDVGCNNQWSVAVTAAGLMFQGQRGYFLLNQSLQLEFKGSAVAGDTGIGLTACNSVVVMPDRGEVRFLGPSTTTAVYNTVVDQWSQWTLYGSSCVYWNGAFTYSNGNTVYQESTAFLDFGTSPLYLSVSMTIPLTGLMQGYARLRRIGILGTYKSQHKLQVTVDSDYTNVNVPTQTVLWDPTLTDVVSGGNYQLIFHASGDHTRGSAIALTVSDANTSSLGAVNGESMQLNEIALEIGVKPGLNRQRANKKA